MTHLRPGSTAIARGLGLLLAAVAAVTGCAAQSAYAPGRDSRLAVMPGEFTLRAGTVLEADLRVPGEVRLASGRVLAFSPLEFRSDRESRGVVTDTLPLGRAAASTWSAEGVLDGIGRGEARTFTMTYRARYQDLTSARRHFPGLPPERFEAVTVDGVPRVEVEQWRGRVTMIFSRGRDAFRVLLDAVEFVAPRPPEPAASPDDAGEALPAPRDVPVIVAFSYRRPDPAAGELVQQNVLFEFTVSSAPGVSRREPQVSGWLPLHADAQTAPYTVGIVVAEVNIRDEHFQLKFMDFIKVLRGVL